MEHELNRSLYGQLVQLIPIVCKTYTRKSSIDLAKLSCNCESNLTSSLFIMFMRSDYDNCTMYTSRRIQTCYSFWRNVSSELLHGSSQVCCTGITVIRCTRRNCCWIVQLNICLNTRPCSRSLTSETKQTPYI